MIVSFSPEENSIKVLKLPDGHKLAPLSIYVQNGKDLLEFVGSSREMIKVIGITMLDDGQFKVSSLPPLGTIS